MLYMEAKQTFPDAVIKEMTGLSEIKHVPACYRMVDTCSAEFTASTLTSTAPSARKMRQKNLLKRMQAENQLLWYLARSDPYRSGYRELISHPFTAYGR